MSIAEKLQTIAENEQKVYDAGYEKGKAEGGGSAIPTTPTDDRTSMSYWYQNLIDKQFRYYEYDEEWNMIPIDTPPLESVKFPTGTQNITDFIDFTKGYANDDGMYCKVGLWTKQYEGTLDATKASSFQYLFASNPYLEKINGKILTSKSLWDVRGVFNGCSALTEAPYFDTSRVDSFISMFYECTSLVTVPEFDTSNGTKFDSMFSNCIKLETVPRFDVSNQSSDFARFSMDQPFYNCLALKNLTVIGVIKASGLNLQWSTKLSKASWVSIMTAASTTASITITGSLVSVNKAFETSKGANDGSDSPEWLALKASRPTVSVSLI